MRCPQCRHAQTRVIDSERSVLSPVIRRRRVCLACGRRFTTYEAWENMDPRLQAEVDRIIACLEVRLVRGSISQYVSLREALYAFLSQGASTSTAPRSAARLIRR